MRKAVQMGPGTATVSAPFDLEAPAGKARRKEAREPKEPSGMEPRDAREGRGDDNEGGSINKKVKVVKQTDVQPQ